jgi:hypothetical protein
MADGPWAMPGSVICDRRRNGWSVVRLPRHLCHLHDVDDSPDDDPVKVSFGAADCEALLRGT